MDKTQLALAYARYKSMVSNAPYVSQDIVSRYGDLLFRELDRLSVNEQAEIFAEARKMGGANV